MSPNFCFRRCLAFSGLLISVVGGLVAEEGPEVEAEADPRLVHEAKLAPFLAKYCFECHGAETQKAELNLQALLADEAPRIEDRREWETVLELILSREMPPEKKEQPSETLRQEVGEYLDARLESFDCSGAVVDPGSVTARRLNRAEYANTIRDLLGVTFEATAAFPRDEVGYGFDNIGDVLSLSPLLMEKYLDAAETVVDEAVLSEIPEWPPVKRYDETEMTPKGGEHVRIVRERYLGLYREGAGEMDFDVPADGQYLVRIKAFQDKAGPEPAKMRVTIAGEVVAEVDVTAEVDLPVIYRLPVQLEKGVAKISVAYTNNYSDNQARDPALRGDRNLFIDYLEVEGPSDQPRPPLPATHVAVIPRQPQPGDEADLAGQIFTRFASKAYRREATPAEVDRLSALAMAVFEDGASFEQSIKVGLTAVLVSPHFLFRWELDPQREGETARPLGGYELASRLSYFLWSSMPDEELTELAATGQLTEPEVLRAQTKRMLADPKAKELVTNFTGQWLQTRNLASVEPNPEVFPEFDEALRGAMESETDLFVQSIVDEDQSVLRLLDADYTYLNQRLAEHYGIDGVEGDDFRRVALDPASRRGGVLTQASVLTITSEPTRTSPVIRGKWVLEQILGTPPPPPPPDVEPLDETKEALESASLRERLEQHRDNPDCSGCHAKMDPIGFALENFDAIGRWRDTDGDFPIDPSGELTGGIPVEGPVDLKRVLVEKEQFVRALSEKLLTYALGRGTEYYDKCAIDLIVKHLQANDFRFSSMIDAIVTSDPFLKRQLQSTSSS